MLQILPDSLLLRGPGGSLPVPPDDLLLRKLAMLYEGECEGLGPLAAAAKFGFSKQRYFQLRQSLQKLGSAGLLNRKRGPKTHYRRTNQVLQQVVRHRFLDPDASAAVLAQKLRQSGHPISTRSVERVIAHFGLQKKTPRLSSLLRAASAGDPSYQGDRPARTSRLRQSRARRPPTPGQ